MERGFPRDSNRSRWVNTCNCALTRSPPDARARWSPWRRSEHSMVTRQRRLTGTSRTRPIGLLQRVPGARRPRVIAGLPASRPLCQSTSRPASVRETRSAAARDCAGRRRTPPVDGRWRGCPGSEGRAIDASRTIGSLQPDVTTTRAAKCRMSVGTARLSVKHGHNAEPPR